MSNVKTLTMMAIASLFAAPAFAQDADREIDLDPALETAASNFLSADLDQDGSLNAHEFVTFAVMRAERGDEAFRDLVLGGEYSAAFAARDGDASSSIEAAELAAQSDEKPESEIVEPEAEEVIVPDL